MKNPLLLPFSIFCFYFLTQQAFAQIEIPGATEQPAWVFPFYFEDGAGQKDTLYFGYDENADWSLLIDNVFGEQLQTVDPVQFHVFWNSCCDVVDDTVVKVNIVDEEPLYGSFFDILIINSFYPIKISWDISLFSDTILPLPDQSPAPRLQAKFHYDYPANVWGGQELGCHSSLSKVLITDTTQYDIPGVGCVRKDSVTFYSPYGIEGMAPMFLEIQRWSGLNLSLNDELINRRIWLYPNPVADVLHIEGIEGATGIALMDFVGRSLLYRGLNSNIREVLDLSLIEPGIYLVVVYFGRKKITKKIFVH